MVKEMEVEKIYQKKSQLEHILLRPDTYIGSTELLQQDMWIWDFENEKMIKKEISFVPGLYKIYDEILGKWSVIFFCKINVNMGYIWQYPYIRSLINGDYKDSVGFAKPFSKRCL